MRKQIANCNFRVNLRVIDFKIRQVFFGLSSIESLPSSWLIKTDNAVNALVLEAIANCVSGVTGMLFSNSYSRDLSDK
jgi:hypothetical protein